MAGQAADSSKVLNKETHEGKAGLCEAVCSCSFIYQLSRALSEPWRGGQGGAAQVGRGRGRGRCVGGVVQARLSRVDRQRVCSQGRVGQGVLRP